MTLNERQFKFTQMVADLIRWSYIHGFDLTFGEAYRTPEQAALNAQKGTGIANSLHCKRLAIDLNMFKDGIYQTDSEAYRPMGDYWVKLDPDCRWGGDFTTRKDGNHFELVETSV